MILLQSFAWSIDVMAALRVLMPITPTQFGATTRIIPIGIAGLCAFTIAVLS